ISQSVECSENLVSLLYGWCMQMEECLLFLIQPGPNPGRQKRLRIADAAHLHGCHQTRLKCADPCGKSRQKRFESKQPSCDARDGCMRGTSHGCWCARELQPINAFGVVSDGRQHRY